MYVLEWKDGKKDTHTHVYFVNANTFKQLLVYTQ